MISERIFFVIERITDILKLENEIQVRYSDNMRQEIQIRYSDDVRKGINELKKELSRLVDYLTDVLEEGLDEQSHHHYRFYVEISDIAVSSDEVVDSVTNNVVDVNDIYDLVKKVHNSYQLLPSQPNYHFNISDNINMIGQQCIGPLKISADHAQSSRIKRVSRPKSYGHVPNSEFVGFNHEIRTLLTHLLHHDETHVVGIVGMGGAGKTTLAKHIYHHPQIRAHFNCKVWVCISQSWDETSILNAIWRQATQNSRAAEMGYDQVVELLSQHLSSQSYLVILDDIWSVDAWYDISPALLPCSRGKVVITTRNRVVPQCIDPTVIIIEPKPLNDEQSLELFRRRTFLPNENISHVLRQLGEKMVQKCKGLPLAIIALAGILRMDKRQISWERISKRLAHVILDTKDASTLGVVKEVLGLSYNELPHYLKPCVLYLHIFPEDYVIKSKVLINMWIAECFIRTKEDDQVSTAEGYLDEMAQRCIIEVVKTNFNGQVISFGIHDLIRQMFVDMDQKRGFLKDPLRLVLCRTLYDEQRHNCYLMIDPEFIANVERFLVPDTSQVRSVICHRSCIHLEDHLQGLFKKFTLLRVLKIHYEGLETRVSEEIGNLIHLRYLELSGYILPVESIGNLENLWTLDLRNIEWTAIVQMNFNLSKLKDLRHLYLSENFIFKTNLELGRLKKLKTLWNVRGGDWLLSTMPVLSADLHELCISIMSNSEEQLEAVFRTPSITSNSLQILKLMWSHSGSELHDLNILSKCVSLKKLWLRGPIEVGTPIVFPPSLIKLTLIGTCLEEREVMNIISKLCPLLKTLILGEDAYIGSELVCNANSFLQLEKLTLEFHDNLRMWIIETSAMPSLHHLTIECFHRDMDLNQQGWTFISNIPRLTFYGPEEFTFTRKLRAYRKDDQNRSRSSDLIVGASKLFGLKGNFFKFRSKRLVLYFD